MKRFLLPTIILAAAATTAGPAMANPELERAYRAGSISPPDLDDSANNAATVSINQGRASYSIPIVAPPGFAGVEPDLALNYLGNQSETVAGTGWALSIPSVRVRTSGTGGQPNYGVAVRILGLSGEELVEIAQQLPDVDGDGASEALFREEFDASRIRYVELSGGGWRVDFPDGRKLTLGRTSDTRIAGEGTADRIVQWLPESLVDTSGNELAWFWTSPDAIGSAVGAAAKAEIPRYLDEMRWGCQDCATADTYQSIAFDYEAMSPHVLDFSPGFLVEWEYAVTSISTSSVAAGSSMLIRDYALTYDTTGTRRVLSSVQVLGADGSMLPPQTFRYTSRDASVSPTTLVDAPNRFFTTGVQAVDVDLDGLPDAADLSDVGLGAAFFRNRPDGALGFDGSVAVSSPGSSLTASGTTSADDATRNVAIDVFDLSTALVYPHDGSGGWAGDGLTAELPNAIASTDTARFDLNGDGYNDLIDTGADPWEFWLDDSVLTFVDDKIELSAAATPSIAASLTVSSDGLIFGQLNADSVVDAIYIDGSGDVAYVFYGRGRGGFGWLTEDDRDHSNSYSTFSINSVGDGPSRSESVLMDVDGDGLGDLVSFDSGSGRLRVWQRVPGGGFQESPMGSPFVQTISTTRGCRSADWDGDGVAEVLCSDGWQLYDWADQSPFLLEEVDNGLGRITRISYSTTARVAADHEAAGHAWASNVSMALPVVDTMEVDDSRGNVLVSRYDYRDARLETDELEDRFAFAGFGYISTERTPYVETSPGDPATRLEDAQDPGVLVRTHYDTGGTDYYLRGTILCEESYARGTEPATYDCDTAGDGALLRVTQSHSTHMDADGIVTRTHDATERAFIEGGAVADSHSTLEEYSYDAFGNRTEVRRFGTGGAHDQTMTVTAYLRNDVDWIVNLPREIEDGEMTDDGGPVTFSPTQRTCFEYDDVAGMCDAAYDGGSDTSAVKGLRTGSFLASDIDPSDGLSDAMVRVSTVDHTPRGLPSVVVDGDGAETDIVYDTEFGLFETSRTVDPGGLTLTTRTKFHRGHGEQLKAVGPDGQATRARYDALGRMTKLARPGDSLGSPTIALTHTASAPVSLVVEVAKETVQDRLTTVRHVDGHGRVVCEVKDAASGSDIVQREFSGRGLLVLDYLPFNAAGCDTPTGSAAGRTSAQPHNATTYDGLGRPVRRIHEPDGAFSEKRYAPLQVTSLDEEDTDPTSPHFDTPRHVFEDGLGRIVSVAEELDSTGDGSLEWHETFYTHDSLGLTRVVDPLGATIYEAEHDARRRVVWSSAADRGEQRFWYDNSDRILTSLDARGHALRYAYDAAGRVVLANANDGTSAEDITYTYDAHSLGGSSGCHTAGRLAEVIDPSGTTQFCYDRRGRTKLETVTVQPYGAEKLATAFTYTKADRRKSVTHPDGTELQYSYDRGGHPEHLVVVSNGANYELVRSAAYNAAGQPTRIEYGNGLDQLWEYDTRLRPHRTMTQGSGAGQLDLTFGFDGTSSLTNIDDGVGARTGVFVYDDWGRLVEAAGDYLGGHQLDYTYDARGNLLSRRSSEPGSPLTIEAFEYDDTTAVHALTGIDRDGDGTTDETFDYDATGNLAEDGSYTFAFDPHGMLRAVDKVGGSTVADYTYDYAQRRVAAEYASGDTVFFVRPASAELRVVGGTKVLRKHIEFAGKTIGVLDDSFVAGTEEDHLFVVVGDHLDQPVLVFDTSASANVVERYATLPFGGENLRTLEEEGTSGDYFPPGDPRSLLSRRFQGREVASGLPEFYDLGARFYRSDLGRFMSADSIVPELVDAQSWNRYAFARNNPMSRVDPSGHNDMAGAEAPPAPTMCTPDNPTGSSIPEDIRDPLGNLLYPPEPQTEMSEHDPNDPWYQGQSPDELKAQHVDELGAISSGLATSIAVLADGPEQAANPALRTFDASFKAFGGFARPINPPTHSSPMPTWGRPGNGVHRQQNWEAGASAPARNPVPPLSAPPPARPPMPGNAPSATPSGQGWYRPGDGLRNLGQPPSAPPPVTK